MTEVILVKSVRRRNDTFILQAISKGVDTSYSVKKYNMSTKLRVHLETLLNGESYKGSLNTYVNAEFITKPNGIQEIFYCDITVATPKVNLASRSIQPRSGGFDWGAKDGKPTWAIEEPVKNGKYWFTGKCIKASDGDTCTVVVDKTSHVESSKGIAGKIVQHRRSGGSANLNGRLTPIKSGDVVSVRYAGIDCRETPKHIVKTNSNGDKVRVPKHGMSWENIKDADDRNYKWLLSWGYPNNDTFLEKAYSLGEDASKFMKFIEGQEVTIIIDDADDNRISGDKGNGVGVDSYNRFLGVVYVHYGSSWRNMNRSMLKTTSASFPPHSLTEIKLYAGENGEQRTTIDLGEWHNDQAYTQKDSITDKIIDESYGNTNVLDNPMKVSTAGVYLRENPSTDSRVLALIPSGTEVYVERTKEVSTENGAIKWGLIQYMASIGWACLSYFKDTDGRYNGIEMDNNYQPTDNFRDYLIKELGATIDGDIVKFGDYDTSNPEFVSNCNCVPADSEVYDRFIYSQDDRDRLDGYTDLEGDVWDSLAEPGFTRIGDCTFIIPPLSFSVTTESVVNEMPSIRAKSTAKSQAGQARRTVSFDLFFNGMEQINGQVVPRDGKNGIPPGMIYYRNGLRPLLAQFKVAPFLPIENADINNMGIHTVAFKDIVIQSVPGFPECIKATIELIEFDHTTYMPHEDDMEEAINWKLFRWNYQRLLQPSHAKKGRTFLAKIHDMAENPIFYRISEDDLADKCEAINELKNYTHPDIYETEYNDDHDFNDLEKDYNAAILAKAQKERADEWAKSLDSVSRRCLFDNNGAGTFRPSKDKFDKLSKADKTKVHNDVVRFMDEVYRVNIDSPNRKMRFAPNMLQEFMQIAHTNYVSHSDSYFIDDDNITYRKISGNKYGTGQGFLWSIASSMYVSGAMGSGMIYLTAEKNKNAMGSSHQGGGVYVIKGDRNFNGTMDKVIKNYDGIKGVTDDYRAKYDKLKEKALKTENDMRYIKEPIPNDYVVENISSSMHNRYATLPTQSCELPTLQYLGSQTASLQMSIRTKNPQVVLRFAEMHKEALRCSRAYREGIVGSVLTVNHPVFNMMGTNSVLLENMQVTNSQEDKETFIINLSFKDFDKTQRMRESLDQVSWGDTVSEKDVYKAMTKMNLGSGKDSADFQYAAIDLKQRTVELYPDLELPTFFEISKDLPHMNIIDNKGNKFTKWPNKTGCRFLDPDFYIRTTSTVRDMMWEEIKRNSPESFLMDQQGFKALEKGPKYGEAQENPDVKFSKDTTQFISENLETVTTAEHSKLGEVVAKQDTTAGSTTSDSDSSSEAWFTGKGEGITTVDGAQSAWNQKVFSEKLFNQMKPDRARSKFKHNTATSMAPVWNSNLVYEPCNKWNQVVPNHGTVLSSVKYKDNDITSVLKKHKISSDDAKKKNKAIISGRFHNLLVQYVDRYFDFLPTYNKKDNGKLQYGECIKLGNQNNPSYMYGKYTISAPEVTREKVVNVMKSIIMYTSDTKQWNESSGNVNYDGRSRVGLTGVNCNNSYINIDTAARSWESNLECGVKYFRQCYLRAYNTTSKGGAGIKEAQRNPLDWAIAIYGLREFHTKISSLKSSMFYKDVLAIFKNEYGGNVSLWYKAGKDNYVDDSLTKKESSDILRKTRDYVIADGVDGSVFKAIKNLFKDKYNEDERRILYQSLQIPGDTIVAADCYYTQVKYLDLDISGRKEKFFNEALKGTSIKRNDVDGIKSNSKLWEKTEKYGVLSCCVVDPFDEVDKGVKDFKTNDLFQKLRKEYNKNKNSGGWDNDIVMGLVTWDIKSRFAANNSKRRPYDWSKYVYVIQKGAYEQAKRILIEWNEDDNGHLQINHGKVNNRSILGRIYKKVNVNDVNAMDQVYDETRQANADADYKRIHCQPYMPGGLGETSECRDLLEHDQRGRLVRAFPTFNVQIIDEGRWLHVQRVFDRFFGYNSILSIDVMKDRRYPADTATVEFSNIYGTLTSEDTSFSTGEWDFCGLDLVPIVNDMDEIWDTLKLMWKLDGEEQTRSQQEKLSSLLLAPGARLSIKMGYGANCAILPHVFMGTIYEVGTGEVVKVVAQGDGAELMNKIADADPKDSTDPGILGLPKEPREMMVEMLSSKGGFFSNTIYQLSEGIFFKQNPLGIAHFGLNNQPNTLWEEVKEKFNMHEDYGEVGYNIYSGTNEQTKSQWIYTEGEKKGEDIGIGFGFNIGPLWFNGKGDAPNIQIYTFDKTPWDLIQTYAYGCPDYIATVSPFEYRSTLFFGKPWWAFVEGYKHEYVIDKERGFIRRAVDLKKKTYAQLKFYDSYSDIISNGIYASKDGVFTNVAAVYNEENGAKRTPIVQIDSDIKVEDQTTTVVTAPIKGNWFTGQEKFAECYATSALRDFAKLMYKGEVVVIGDPTVKPYDVMYLSDAYNAMSGTSWVRRVTHSFDLNGYTTQITPDLISVIDDMEGVSFAQWASARAMTATASIIGCHLAKSVYRSKVSIPIARIIKRTGSAQTADMLADMIAGESKLGGNMRKARLNELEQTIRATKGMEYDDIVKFLKKNKVNVTDSMDVMRAVKKYSNELETMSKLGKSVVYAGDAGAYTVAKTERMLQSLATNPQKYIDKIDDFYSAAGGLAKTFKKNSKEYGKLASRMGSLATKATRAVTETGVQIGSKGAQAILLASSSSFIIPAVIAAGTWIISETLIEKYERFLRNRQALLLIPMDYHGKPLLAGVKGHRGAVLGDSPSKMDRFLSGNGKGSFGFMDPINFFLGVDIDYGNYNSDFHEDEE